MSLNVDTVRNVGLAVIVALASSVYWFLTPKAFHHSAPPASKALWPIIGCLDYFRKPFTFFTSERRRVEEKGDKSSHGAFSYNIGKLLGVGLTGEAGRELFFTSSSFNFSKGYELLFGGTPKYDEAAAVIGEGSTDDDQIIKVLKQILTAEKIDPRLNYLMDDVQSELAKLGSSGTTDPFESIYGTVFLMTMRTVGAVELVRDEKLRAAALGWFEGVAAGMSAMAMIFPYFPSPSRIKAVVSGTRLYLMVRNIIQKRQKEDRQEDDVIQMLMDKGDTTIEIIHFVLQSVLAGQINTGVNAAYILAYLGSSPEWLEKVRVEVEDAAFRHGGSGETLAEQLRMIPLKAWETEFPLIDACIKESIRLNLPGVAPRLNDRSDVKIGDYMIPKGSFVSYAPYEVHLDPTLYPNPLQFNPAHFLPGQETTKEKLAFVGWGAGRHPCLGMRFAKLEMALIVAFFVATYEWDVVRSKKDGANAPAMKLEDLPPVNVNAQAAEPPKVSDRVFLRYHKREE